MQTRKQELLELRLKEWERLQAREKLTISEKELSGLIFQKGIDNAGFARIRSKGDQALFGGKTTRNEEIKKEVTLTLLSDSGFLALLTGQRLKK